MDVKPDKQGESMGMTPPYTGNGNQGYSQGPGYSQPPNYSQTPGYPQQPAYPTQYGQPQQQSTFIVNSTQAAPVFIEDNMVKAILVTIFCFWPTGIAAIIKADSANTKARLGDTTGASSENQEARKYIKISLIVGVIAIILAIILIIVVVVVRGNQVKSMYDSYRG